jgi:two-component system sensor histidine kinase/response regulator
LRLHFTILFLLIAVSSFASISHSEVDSLKMLVETSLKSSEGGDKVNIDRLNKLAADYFESNPDSTIYYAQISIDLSRKINYQEGIANGLVQLGHAHYFRGKFKDASQNFDEAILIYKRLNDKQKLSNCYVLYSRMYNLQANYQSALNFLNLALNIVKELKQEPDEADCYKNIGIVYYSKGDLSTALDFYFKALYLDLKLGNKLAAAANYNDIGAVLQNMEVYPKALEYFKKSLNIFQDSKDLLAVGTLNQNIGEVLLAQKNYDSAIVYLTKAILIARQQDDKDGMSSVYTDLGLCYAHKNQPVKAIYYLTTSLKIASKYKIVYNEANTLIGFATAYNLQKNYKAAYKYALEGQKSALKLGNLSVRANAALQLNETLAGLNKFDEAYKYLRQYNRLKDSLNNNETIQKLTSYNLTLNFTEKQAQLAQQQGQKDIAYQHKIDQQELLSDIFLIITLGMIAVAIVYYRQKRKKEKVNAMLEEKNREVLQQKANLDDQAQKLNELNVLKDRLMSVLAHDLRSPLSTLRGLFSLLQDDTISHEQMLEMIPEVLKKLDYTSDFLDTLLFWINSQMENFENTAQSFYVKDIVAVLTENYHEQAALKGISLVDKVPFDVIASADPDSIRIVIRNLVTNAIKFSKKNDVIEISAAHYDGQTNIITVKDSGIGISEEHLNKLFKNKVNSKEGTNHESGTGMGLMFCKDLVEKSGGKIWVTSKQGYGTEFSFTLPADILNEADLELV